MCKGEADRTKTPDFSSGGRASSEPWNVTTQTEAFSAKCLGRPQIVIITEMLIIDSV